MGMGTYTHNVQAGMFTETPTMSRQRYLTKISQHGQSRLVFIVSFFFFFAFSFWCHGFECNYLLLYQFILHSFLVALCLCAWNCFTILKLYRFNSDLNFKLYTHAHTHTHTHTQRKEKGKKNFKCASKTTVTEFTNNTLYHSTNSANGNHHHFEYVCRFVLNIYVCRSAKVGTFSTNPLG